MTTRECLRPTGRGRLRSAVPRTQGHRHGPARKGPRLSPGAPGLSGITRSATAALCATASRMSSQALGPHVVRGQGQTCVLTARQQRASPAKGCFQGWLRLSKRLAPPLKPPLTLLLNHPTTRGSSLGGRQKSEKQVHYAAKRSPKNEQQANKALEPTAPMAVLWHEGVVHGAAAHRWR